MGRPLARGVNSVSLASVSLQTGPTGKIFLPIVSTSDNSSSFDGNNSWPTVAGNQQRTSWTPEEVSGNIYEGSLKVEWYRPVEAYISQNTQIIAANGKLYIATARGLYALNASNGSTVWRYDTDLPIGNSPTVVDQVVYVGGYDKRIHALSDSNGHELWSFNGATAGYSTNPLVVGGKVFAGNRDGFMYAIGAHGTSRQGQLIWKYKTGGLIDTSAAYKNGVVYFASNDNYAYALSAETGQLIWKSDKLLGDGFHSFWPVVYTDPTTKMDWVIFSGASGYRENVTSIGTGSVLCPSWNPNDPNQVPCDATDAFYKMDIFYDKPNEDKVGPVVSVSQPWAQGKTVINVSRVVEDFENNPDGHAHLHKPWRRSYFILNATNGSEFTFDSDHDGKSEYVPVIPNHTRSGNFYPPIVGSDGMLYFSNLYEKNGQGRVMGWPMGTPYMILAGGQSAFDEPESLSSGGSIIYRNLCCDRVGDWFNINQPDNKGTVWSYDLNKLVPGYDEMWWGQDPNGLPGYSGNYGNVNGIYHSHGDQNPLIPYQGQLFVHRSNAIIAFGHDDGPGKLALLTIQNSQSSVTTFGIDDLKARLENEINKICDSGQLLRPGYYNSGQFGLEHYQLDNYFDNPGDTLYTLTKAYPYLSTDLQEKTRGYLQQVFGAYFDPVMYARTGWADGQPREAAPLPLEVDSARTNYQKSTSAWYGWSWEYPQYNFYAMWKYAQIFPAQAGRVYDLAKSKLVVPVPADNIYLDKYPWEHNGYIAGYIGFLNLQNLAGKAPDDSQLRSSVNNELTRLLQLRASGFDKDTYWTDPIDNAHKRTLNLSRNFIMLVPELGNYLNQNAYSKVNNAIAEYNLTGPYWFVTRYNGTIAEGVKQNLYDTHGIFLAKAYILKQSQAELTKYLDAPAFEKGDLFYIQNLIAAIEAP